MSFALFVNVLFPSRATSPSAASTTLNGPPGVSSAGEHLQLQARDTSGTNITDVEAQTVHDIQPNGQEPEAPARRFRLSPRMIGDLVLGLSDGLTVPFALTAGLSSFGTTHIVVFGGLAELLAGAISMGLGGYLAAKSEANAYATMLDQTRALITTSRDETVSLVDAVFSRYRLPVETIRLISEQIHASPAELLEFLMCFHYQLAKPQKARPYVSACTIAMGYLLGGLFPLVPYFCVKHNEVLKGLWWSIGVMVIVLFVFGWGKVVADEGWKGRENVVNCVRSALEMVVIGATAAGSAVGLVRLLNRH